jgi:hypothetical protein
VDEIAAVGKVGSPASQHAVRPRPSLIPPLKACN